MKLFTTILYAVTTAFTLASCDNTNEQAVAIFKQVAAMVEQNPDSALLLLSAIEQPENLPREQCMEYVLRKVQAKDKAYQDITADTFIFEVAQYYTQRKKADNASLAYLYCGRVYQEQKQYKEATEAYLKAKDYAEKTTDIATKGLINHFLGEMHYHACAMQEAMAYYKAANQCFYKLRKYRSVIGTFLSIGNCFLFEEKQDSALLYYNQGLQHAELHQEIFLLSDIHQAIGLIFEQKKDFSSAAAHFQRAEKLGIRKEFLAMLYHNLAHSHYHLGRHDLSSLYVHKILSLHAADSSAVEIIDLANAYELLSFLAEWQGQHSKALAHHRRYVELIFPVLDERMNTSVREMEKKYNMEEERNQHNRQIIKYLRIRIVLLFLLLVATFIALLFRRYYLRAHKQLRYSEKKMNDFIQWFQQLEVKEKELRKELEVKGKMLEDMAKNSRAKEKIYDDSVEQRLSSLREATLWKWGLNIATSEQLKEKEWLPKFNKAVYGYAKGSNWELFYKAVNDVYNGKLNRYPASLLNEDEQKICILLFAHFNEAETSVITGLSNRLVRQKKSSIRQKLNIAEYGGILEVLQNMIR